MIITYQRIRDLREDKDLLQRAIADDLGIIQQAYSYYESGQRTMPPSFLIQLADYHNTSIDYLLERTDIKNPYPQKK